MSAVGEKKAELLESLNDLKEDIKTLNQNIAEFETIVDSIQTEDDIIHCMEFDVEEGLKHIELFFDKASG